MSDDYEHLAGRFRELADASQHGSEGMRQVARGLHTMREEVRTNLLPQQTLRALTLALETLVTVLEGREAMQDERTPIPGQEVVAKQQGLGRFVEAFILESRKRMAGLSIAINGIFDEDNQAAVKQSLEHLHAIRGGAALLNLGEVARLSGALERCIEVFGRSTDQGRPTRPILRSFAVLQSALENPEEPMNALVDDVIEELEGAVKNLKKTRSQKHIPNAMDTRVLEQRILVVDDVESIAASIGFILSDLDVPIDIAHSAPEALERLHKGAYSLVVSDVSMPGMDGIELVREMRSDELLQDVPVILLSQLDTPAERQKGMDAGASDYIVKGSMGGGELLNRVNDLLLDAPYVPTEEFPPRTILIVEDTETIAASIAFVLSEGAFDIDIAHDGDEALQKIKRRPFDLILSDIEMPGMTGIELLRHLKADPRLAQIPFVVLTSRSSGANAEEAIRLGAAQFIIKGDIPATELLDVITSILDS